jgi:hypothetical protein
MSSFPQYEKIVFDEFYMFMKIYDHTDSQVLSDPRSTIENGKKELLYPLLVEFEENSPLLETECIYTFKDQIGYAKLRGLDKALHTPSDSADVQKLFQLIFQIGKQKGHEVLFLAFHPTVSADRYKKLWETMLGIYTGIFRSIYYLQSETGLAPYSRVADQIPRR